MLVVDASVAAKWFLDEGDSEDALRILELDFKLVGPTLAKYEVAAAFFRRARDGQVAPDDAALYRDRWLHAIATNVLRLSDDDRDIVLGGEIALQLGHVLPDCVYLAMAQRLSIPFVTADGAFARKARARFEAVLSIAEVLQLAA